MYDKVCKMQSETSLDLYWLYRCC